MNTMGRTISGICLIVASLGLIAAAFFGFWPTLFYGIPLLILGIFILFNKKEDKIEEIKVRRKKK